MSFSIEFYAASKSAAKSRLSSESSLPSPVRAFLAQAVDGIKVADEDHPRVIHVKAHGHLCSGGDYDVSNADMKVYSIPIAR